MKKSKNKLIPFTNSGEMLSGLRKCGAGRCRALSKWDFLTLFHQIQMKNRNESLSYVWGGKYI